MPRYYGVETGGERLGQVTTQFPAPPDTRHDGDRRRDSLSYEAEYWRRWRGIPSPGPYKDWFESMFPKTLRRFKAQLELEEPKATEEELLKTWPEWLEARKPKEEFGARRPIQRGEQPYAFAPRIRTVRF